MLEYSGKVILAPMVRVSTLPVRLLCLKYGADIVYSEEIVDYKLLSAVRHYNERLQTVDYVDPSDGIVVFRTCAEERDRVVLQIGTADPQRAVQVAKKVQGDVAGIDVNMGCPKDFSMKGGMGAALLTQPDKVQSILSALVAAVDIPITCKIRIVCEPHTNSKGTVDENCCNVVLNTDATDVSISSADNKSNNNTSASGSCMAASVCATARLCELAAQCGVSAVAVHGRTRYQRPRHTNNDAAIARVAASTSVPVIANGGSRRIACRADIDTFRDSCGASSVMVARAAMWNMSVFSPGGPQPLDDVITQLLTYCIRYDHPFTLVKYTVQQMLGSLQETPRGKRFLATQTLHDICEIWGLSDLCMSTLGPASAVSPEPIGALVTQHIGRPLDPSGAKRPRLADGVCVGRHHFVRGQFTECNMPKTVLHNWARATGGSGTIPTYTLQLCEKLFRAVCSHDGRQYASAWEKNKKWAEQGAALTCLLELGMTSDLPPAFSQTQTV